MLRFEGRNFVSPLEGSKNSNIPKSTIYGWIRKNKFKKEELLNMSAFCIEKKIDRRELRAGVYINVHALYKCNKNNTL